MICFRAWIEVWALLIGWAYLGVPFLYFLPLLVYWSMFDTRIHSNLSVNEWGGESRTIHTKSSQVFIKKIPQIIPAVCFLNLKLQKKACQRHYVESSV